MKTKSIVTILIVVIFFMTLTIFSIYSIIHGNNNSEENMLYAGAILLTLEISYFFISCGIVKTGQVAAFFILGDAVIALKPGIYCALLGIMSVREEKGTLFNDELPGDPEKIYRDEGKVPDGMFAPIRVKFGQPDPGDKKLEDDPYNVAMVTEVVPVINWHISDPIKFFKIVGTIENCRVNLADKTVEVFGNKFATITPAAASLKLEEVSNEIEAKLINETSTWGITINSAYIKPFVFSHGLNSAVIDVSVKKLSAKGVRLTADGEKYRLTEEGAGKADAEKLWLSARAIGIKKLATATQTPAAQIVLWMETMSKAFEKAQYSVIPGSELFASIAGVKEMLEKMGKGIEK